MKTFTFKKIFMATALCLSVSHLALADDFDSDKNWAIDSAVGFDFSSYSNVNVGGGVGFGLSVRPAYYFSQYVGLFTGVDGVWREMSLNSTSRTRWLEVPVGFSFRYSMYENVQNTLAVGVYYSKALGAFKDAGGDIELGHGMGFLLSGSTLFPINENFAMGITADAKFALFSPFKSLSSPKAVSLMVGLASRYTF